MAIFKCKMCGGALEINNGETIITCEYCGTQQTLPKLDDEKRAQMYDRANHFRRNNEYDKAMGIYEQILNEDNTDSEAYWSLVLCRFGIEYVEDPASRKRVPTVNRAQFTSIYDDDNYKSAIEYADGYQKSIYEEEAKAINEIQKGILAISQKEETSEVFACYKETDNSGGNTNVAPLLERAFVFLEEEDWNSADECCEKVLDSDPENALAYLGKLMVDLKVKTKESLKEQPTPFDENSNYQKLMRFADDTLKSEIEAYMKTINENICEETYKNAVRLMAASSQEEKAQAIELFKTIPGYKDADALTEACLNKIDTQKKEEILKEAKQKECISKRIKKIAMLATSIACVVIAFVILLNAGIPNIKYNNAITLMDSGNVIEAYETFVTLDGYKDSTDKANSIYDKYMIEKLKVAKVGDRLFFGHYEQDNNTDNDKEVIEWIVLDKQDGKLLVISKYALDCQPYNEDGEDVTWEVCTLRKWLNDDFINAAFSTKEKAMIPTVTVEPHANPDYDTNPGDATQDRVFLLSIPEVNKYFSSDSARVCKPTEYAVGNGAFKNYKGTCRWWLRSTGVVQDYAAVVYIFGIVHEFGNNVYIGSTAVRPALWIDLNS